MCNFDDDIVPVIFNDTKTLNPNDCSPDPVIVYHNDSTLSTNEFQLDPMRISPIICMDSPRQRTQKSLSLALAVMALTLSDIPSDHRSITSKSVKPPPYYTKYGKTRGKNKISKY